MSNLKEQLKNASVSNELEQNKALILELTQAELSIGVILFREKDLAKRDGYYETMQSIIKLRDFMVNENLTLNAILEINKIGTYIPSEKVLEYSKSTSIRSSPVIKRLLVKMICPRL